MSANDTTNGLKANLIERLHHPMQLRIFITAVVLLVGYGGVYMPLDSSIADTVQRLSNEERRLGLARNIEFLRAQQKKFQDRIPKLRDPNEWVEYMLGEIRTLPLKLVALEAKTPQDVGPYKAVVLNCEMEGAFHDIEKLLRWIEFNERLLRVDSVRISPHRSNSGTLVLHLIVLGVMG
jgi:Tfp pilus assembly protein PilO